LPKLLWVGDAGPKTGFEYVSNGFLRQLQALGWDVGQIGINYQEGMDTYPWPILPAHIGGDFMGLGCIERAIKEEKPDVVLLLNDSWAVLRYLRDIPKGTNVVVYPPVDAPNQPAGRLLNGFASLVICPTQFGVDEIVKGGWTGPTAVVGYGIHVSHYGGVTTQQARAALKMPDVLMDAFIVGNVNRNAPRKRIDLTMKAFSSLRSHVDNAYLLLHMDPFDPWGWDILQMAEMFGIVDRLILTAAKPGEYSSHERLSLVYSALDVQISTTVGEGWGLTTAEGMASRVPQVVPRYSALGEWADGGACFYSVEDTQVSPGGMNTVWAVPSVESLVEWVAWLSQPERRETEAQKALAHIWKPEFSWNDVGDKMDKALRSTL
jgi:D-inositol-3-phosphate glycosyltransferase